jgi:hypothetical protein
MMQKQNLSRAQKELFRRSPDETFSSLAELRSHCERKRVQSADRWHPPADLRAERGPLGSLTLKVGTDGAYEMTDWSFGQLCRLAGVGKETVNRLSADTAGRVFAETLPAGSKPLQLFTEGDSLRSIHGTSYTRLFDAEVVSMLEEFATGFEPPQKGLGGATGLYAGEQDLFCFLIDPTGWTEIEGEAFAPGFFIWNSEVGRRSLGIETFWFQAVCQNHLVWDAVEVVEYSRKHTASVHDSLADIRRIIEGLVAKRDERRDAFASVIRRAMQSRYGDSQEERLKMLARDGIPRNVAKEALDLAEKQGRFTIFSLVDALTRIAGRVEFAGERMELDAKASALLALAI